MKKLIFLIMSVFLFANSCENKLFTFQNNLNPDDRLSVREFLNLLLVDKCGINIVYSEEKIDDILDQKMPFVKFKNYTLNQMLDFILTKKLNLFYKLKNNEMEIKYLVTKTYEFNFLSNERKGDNKLSIQSAGTGDNQGSNSNNIENSYTFSIWDKIEKDLNEILKNNADVIVKKSYIKQKDGSLQEQESTEYYPLKEPIVNKEAGIITITGNIKQIRAVDRYIENVKKSLTREVLIDVKIYTVELSKSHSNGINWSQLSLALPNTSVPVRGSYIGGSKSIFNSATFNSGAFINFLAQNGNVNSLSNPKVMTLNNQKSIINVGEWVSYIDHYEKTYNKDGNIVDEKPIYKQKFIGLVLDIVPQISRNGEIILNVTPSISSLSDRTQLENREGPPDTKENKMSTIIRVKDGSTIVLGGLITRDKSLQVNGVPVLKEIPLIKYLFSSKEEVTNKKELVFVITPHIINLNKKVNLRDLGFGKF